MKIGIIEVCEPNHYTAVEALAETYGVGSENEIAIFTLSNIAKLFSFNNPQIAITSKSDDQDMGQYLQEIASAGFDRIHINTISRFYEEFAAVNWSGSIYFTVHNIELWYDNPIAARCKVLISGLKDSLINRGNSQKFLPLILFIKDFKRQYLRYQIIRKISKCDHKIIVYSQSQQIYLSNYISIDKTLVFPFCLTGNLADTSATQSKLRICIPGSVSNRRRNYSDFFKMLINHSDTFKNKIVIDLLGYIPASDRFLVEDIKSLHRSGIETEYNLDFIDTNKFDQNLAKCDIILGNLRVQVNVNTKYGETKETGVLFNIIKAGKPGLLPGGYPVDTQLKDICLHFNDYEHLADIIKNLLEDDNTLTTLKMRAHEAVKFYNPVNLYPKLT